MKCLSAEASPKAKAAIVVAILLQSYNCFAEGEVRRPGNPPLSDDQVMHWLSQPENRESAKVTENSSDAEKTKIVIEINNTDINTAGATSSLNRTIPSANTAIPLTQLPSAQDEAELTIPLAMPLQWDLAADQSPPAQPADNTSIAANNSNEFTAPLQWDLAADQSPPAQPADNTSIAANNSNEFTAPLQWDLVADQSPPAQPVDNTSIAANNGKTKPAPILSPHAVHNARLAMQTAGDALNERMSSQRTGMDKGHGFANQGAWIQYSYNKTTQDVRDSVPGYQAKTNGFSIGTDSVLENNQDIRTGVAYTYARGRANGESGIYNTIDTSTNILSLYTSSQEGNYFFDGRLSYAFGKNSGQRTDAGNRLDASYRAKSWGVGFVGGYDVELQNPWYWQPKMAFNYYTIDTDDYSELARDPLQPSPFAQVNSGRYSILELGAGISLLADLAAKDTTIRPELGVMAFHDFKKDPVEVTAHYVTGESFPISLAQRTRNRYQAEAALNVNVLDHTVCTLGYAYHWASHFKASDFIARISYEF